MNPGENVREFYRRQGMSRGAKESFARGILDGKRAAVSEVIEYVNVWYEHGDIILMEELLQVLNSKLDEIKEIESEQQEKDYGKVASISSVGKGEDICQDCFGPDLCLVCERTDRR